MSLALATRCGRRFNMHGHTMYRDPTNDYGIRFTGAQ